MWAASHSRWPKSTNISCLPCSSRTGTEISARSNPQGRIDHTVVVPPSLRAWRKPVLGGGCQELSQVAGEHRCICRSEQRCQYGRDVVRCRGEFFLPVLLGLGTGCGLVGHEQTGVIDISLAHSGEIVESVGVKWGQRSERRGGAHQVGEQRGARKHMRAAARDAPRCQAIDAEVGADRKDIRGAVGDSPAWLRHQCRAARCLRAGTIFRGDWQASAAQSVPPCRVRAVLRAEAMSLATTNAPCGICRKWQSAPTTHG
jgi:hypothetical protein